MEKSEVFEKGFELIGNSKIVFLATNDEKGYPIIKGMLNMENDGLKRIWFGTNASSKKVSRIERDQRACVYCVDEENFRGLTLVGDIGILKDPESKRRLWREGFERYYPLGAEDPDYCVLEFTAKKATMYHGLEELTLEL